MSWPVAEWAAIRARHRTGASSENGFVIYIAGLVGFVAAVGLWTLQATRVFPSLTLEVMVTTALLATSQVLFRNRLKRHFRTADLV